MKLVELNNAFEVKDLDINDDEACKELGRIAADKCVIFVDQDIGEQRLYDIQSLWGTPSRGLIEEFVCENKLQGSHWRELLVNLGHISTDVSNFKDGMTRVSYAKNLKGKPTGIFTNGELDWHSDQQSYNKKQRIIGLSSLYGSKNSQTSFMCTAPVYDSLNHEDKTMVDELVSVWEWDDGTISAELIPSQMEIVRYHFAPLDGLECPLVDETASGRKGFKFPSHCFKQFKGMSVIESVKIKKHIWSKLNDPKNIYIHNWKDGQTVFMDQNITLHARPTNVKDGDRRTMARMVSYLDKIFPNQDLKETIQWKGENYSHEQFAHLIDEQRRKDFFKDSGLVV